MKETIILREHDQLDSLMLKIRAKIDDKKLYEVVIQLHSFSRSLEQNALMWEWLTMIGKDLGYTKDEMHLEMKVQFLIAIYKRNPDRHDKLHGKLKRLATVYKGNNALGLAMHRDLADSVSTTDATVKEMSEYLDCIDGFATSNNIRLPLPADVGLDERAWKR